MTAARTCLRTLNEMRQDLVGMPRVTVPVVSVPMVRCRYLDRKGVQCTAEAVDAVGEILLCTGHLARALELLKRRGALR